MTRLHLPAIIAAACVIVLASLSGVQAQGPSFNCRYASTYVEIAICDSRELSRLDRVLNLEYRRAMNRIGFREGAYLADDQSGWIGMRDNCGSYGCIADAYRRRIAFLRGYGRY